MIREDILRKIRSLLSLSNDHRGNESESYAAMLAARKLMIKYNVVSQELVDDTRSVVVELPLSYTFSKRYTYYTLYLSVAISKYNRCRVLSGYHNERSHSLFIVGEKDDAEYVRSVCEYAYSIIQRFLSEIHADLYAKGYRRDDLVTMKNSWAYGYVDGLIQYYERQTSSVDGGALMCIIPDTVIRYMNQYCDSHDSNKKIRVNSSLYDEGYDEAKDFFSHNRLRDTMYLQEVV